MNADFFKHLYIQSDHIKLKYILHYQTFVNKIKPLIENPFRLWGPSVH